MKRYWKYIKPYLPAFIIGPVLMIVEVVGEVAMPFLCYRKLLYIGIRKKEEKM